MAKNDETFTSESGLKLKLKKVSRYIALEIGNKIPVPDVPTWVNEDKGREEENPNDPDYLKAVQKANYDRAMLVTTSTIALGTEITTLPTDMVGPDDDEWLEVLEALDIQVEVKNKRLRYCAWLKYIGLPNGTEFDELTMKVLRYSGLVSEEDVQKAQDSFRSSSNGKADLVGAVKEPA